MESGHDQSGDVEMESSESGHVLYSTAPHYSNIVFRLEPNQTTQTLEILPDGAYILQTASQEDGESTVLASSTDIYALPVEECISVQSNQAAVNNSGQPLDQINTSQVDDEHDASTELVTSPSNGGGDVTTSLVTTARVGSQQLVTQTMEGSPQSAEEAVMGGDIVDNVDNEDTQNSALIDNREIDSNHDISRDTASSDMAVTDITRNIASSDMAVTDITGNIASSDMAVTDITRNIASFDMAVTDITRNIAASDMAITDITRNIASSDMAVTEDLVVSVSNSQNVELSNAVTQVQWAVNTPDPVSSTLCSLLQRPPQIMPLNNLQESTNLDINQAAPDAAETAQQTPVMQTYLFAPKMTSFVRSSDNSELPSRGDSLDIILPPVADPLLHAPSTGDLTDQVATSVQSMADPLLHAPSTGDSTDQVATSVQSMVDSTSSLTYSNCDVFIINNNQETTLSASEEGRQVSTTRPITTDEINDLPTHPATSILLTQIYSEVAATLSGSILEAIPGSKDVVLKDLACSCKVQVDQSTEESYVLRGGMPNILQMEKHLAKFVTDSDGLAQRQFVTNTDELAQRQFVTNTNALAQREFLTNTDDLAQRQFLRNTDGLAQRQQTDVGDYTKPKTVETDDKGVLCDLLKPKYSMSGRQVRWTVLDGLDSTEIEMPSSKRKKRSYRTRKRRKRNSSPPKGCRLLKSGRKRVNSDEVCGGQEGHTEIKREPQDKGKVDMAHHETNQAVDCTDIEADNRLRHTTVEDDIKAESSEKENEGAQKDVNEETADVGADVPIQMGTIVLGRPKHRKNYEAITAAKFFCDLCSFKTKRLSHMTKHRERHESHSTYRCDQCDFVCMTLGHLRRHQLKQHSKNKMSCEKCSYLTHDEKALRHHTQKKHQGILLKKPLRVFECSNCDYKTTYVCHFKRHLRCHSLGDTDVSADALKKNFECEQCSYKTSQKEHYRRHIRYHNSQRPYLCDICGFAFKRKDSLKQHKIVHQDKSQRVFQFHCEECNKGCRSMSHLKEHMTIHTTERGWLCEHCGASFKSKSTQRKHIQNIHFNPGAHQCTECSRRFNTKYALARHIKTHDFMSPVRQSCPITITSDGVAVTSETIPQSLVLTTTDDLTSVKFLHGDQVQVIGQLQSIGHEVQGMTGDPDADQQMETAVATIQNVTPGSSIMDETYTTGQDNLQQTQTFIPTSEGATLLFLPNLSY